MGVTNEFKIKKILQEHIDVNTSVGIKEDLYMYITEKGNIYVNNNTDGKLKQITNFTYVSTLPVLGDKTVIYVLNNKDIYLWNDIDLKFNKVGDYEGTNFLKDSTSVNNKVKEVDFIGTNFKLTNDGANPNRIKIEFVKDKIGVIKSDGNLATQDLKNIKFNGLTVKDEADSKVEVSFDGIKTSKDNVSVNDTTKEININGNDFTIAKDGTDSNKTNISYNGFTVNKKGVLVDDKTKKLDILSDELEIVKDGTDETKVNITFNGIKTSKDGVSVNDKSKEFNFIGTQFKVEKDGTNENKTNIEFIKKVNVVDKANANITSDITRLKFIGAKVENEGGATDNGQIKIIVDTVLINGNTETVMIYNENKDPVSVTVFNETQTETISNTTYDYNETTGDLEEELIAYPDYNVSNKYVYDADGDIISFKTVIS